MRSGYVCAAIAVALFGSVILQGAALGQGRPLIILYQHVDFQGRQQAVDRDIRDFESIRFNDDVSSIRVQSGVWEVCEHADFRGRCITLGRDNPNLVPDGLNDRISSVRLVSERGGFGGGFGRRDRDREGERDRDWDRDRFGGRDRGGITLYQHADYRGTSRRVEGENRNLQSVGLNDEASSVRVETGIWELCEHADFGGRCIRVDRDVRNLQDMGFNDRLSSVRRLR